MAAVAEKTRISEAESEALIIAVVEVFLAAKVSTCIALHILRRAQKLLWLGK